MSDYYIRIKGDVWVNVAPTPANLTTYVLLEQEDWFEKEIGFVRRFLRSGMCAIDIGANHGVYALSMAKAVRPGGRVWAFEPVAATATMLRRSIARNGLDNLDLRTLALSDHEGTDIFYTYPNSEMNSFTRFEATDGSVTEEVTVSTLDRQFPSSNGIAMDFVKIDAEGEEMRIVEAGERFFVDQSPLVMFEINNKNDDGSAAVLGERLHRLGYGIYRLIGPDALLVPVVENDVLDPFEFNLFACKPDRATQLGASGLLVPQVEAAPVAIAGAGLSLFRSQAYASSMGSLAFQGGAYERALDAYAMWRDPRVSPGQRYAALCQALAEARDAARDDTSGIERLSSLARIAAEAGQRALAVDTLTRLRVVIEGGDQPPVEPFFPALARYDAIDPGAAARQWFLAASFEALELMQTYSSAYESAQPKNRQIRQWLLTTPFASPAIERRRQLQLIRDGRQAALMAAPILALETPDNLNPGLWAGRSVMP